MSKELTTKVAQDLGMNKADAAKAVKSVLSGIKEITADRGHLTIVGFGTFLVRRFKRTSKLFGKNYPIDKKVVRFKAGSDFKDLVE